MDFDPTTVSVVLGNPKNSVVLTVKLEEGEWNNNTLAQICLQVGKATSLPVDYVTVENSVMAFGSDDEMWPVE